MKQQLLIGTVLFAAINAFAQSPRPERITRDARTIIEYKFGSAEGAPTSQINPGAVKPLKKSSSTASTNWVNFTSSMNIYGVSNSFVKPLQWNDELNAVSFIHRKSLSYVSSPVVSSQAENGTIVAMISTDCGTSWDSTAMWVNNNFWGRFPGGAIYNPPSNTSISNAYMVGAGPATGASTGWTGNWYSSKQIGPGNYNNSPSAVPNATQLAITAGSPLPNVDRHDFSAYGFTATDDGKMRVLAGITDDALSPASDTAVMLITGTYNSGVFDWVGRSFWMPVTKRSDGSSNFIPRPMMAWNEAGTIGYMVVMGSRLGATGPNTGYQPIVHKTTDGGQTWTLESVNIDFNSPAFSDVLRPLSTTADVPTLKIPNFWWGEGMDCAIDANNKLHIFTTIISHTSTHMDSLDFIFQFMSQRYMWSHQKGDQPYLYDFIYDGTNSNPSWSHKLVDSMSTEAVTAKINGPGYNDNPWDPDPAKNNDKYRIDARLQMSRTPDGRHLLYAWAESDTSITDWQRQWNTFPDVKMRMLDVIEDTIPDMEINVTSSGPGDVSSRGMCFFMSPKFKLVSKTLTKINVEVPVTVSNSFPYTQLSPNTHWYSCAGLEFERPLITGIASHKAPDVSSSYLYPNPAAEQVTVHLNMKNAGSVQVDVMNAVGQIVRSQVSEGRAGENNIPVNLPGLSSGIYFVKIKANATQSTQKLVIE